MKQRPERRKRRYTTEMAHLSGIDDSICSRLGNILSISMLTFQADAAELTGG
jgi:hypothetical protein